ncbi:Na+/H+ antiporter subunit E [Streptomyces sp. N2-109]|uniref:Na+/H+ antiporter subunit E n=1 Tax=Streptomyces gossypii TaxID=2883101 RepID=A0ABT2JU15_9ACTN|nr:Na+/H+ antiporter subunit E [Streptomyces gossypii]MCT2590974.1 Na+/H+ antiporter subunit E [Streptomyces gossypii]
MRELANRYGHHLPMVCWLWLLWAVLWGSVMPGVLLSGLLVATGIVLAFPLPPIRPRLTPRPWRLAWLLAHLFTHLVHSAVTVAWQAVRHGPRTPTAIVEVPLGVDSDLTIAALANLTTASPGSLVLEIDRGGRLLYVHVLPVHSPEEADEGRVRVQRAERHVVWALGVAGQMPGDRGEVSP